MIYYEDRNIVFLAASTLFFLSCKNPVPNAQNPPVDPSGAFTSSITKDKLVVINEQGQSARMGGFLGLFQDSFLTVLLGSLLLLLRGLLFDQDVCLGRIIGFFDAGIDRI